MKTIMHIAEAFGGGIVTFLANLANQQVENYHVVIVHGIRPETHKNYKDIFDPRVQFVLVKHFNQRIHFGTELKALNELRGLIHEYKPDIIHMHSSQAGVLGKIASFGYKCNKAYSPHGFSFLREDVAKWKRYIFYLIERGFSFFNSVTVASSVTEFHIANKVTSKSILIMNGISCESLKPYESITPQNDKPVVGMVGRALYQKNPELFNAIAERMPNVHFEWIGDGSMRDCLKSPNIHIVGWGPREEALEYVANCDIYIMTSRWEGMPLSLLEAMYLHKPCVVTNVVGNRDVIHNDKNGFVCNDIDEFVVKIQYLADKSSERFRMGEQGHKDVETIYNSRMMAKHFTEAYSSSKKDIKEWHKRDVAAYL